MDSQSLNALPNLPPLAAGVKRPAESIPTLLPAFEFESSSPSLPRPVKRVARAPLDENDLPGPLPSKYGGGRSKYPTPVPTSSTGILSSSPPRRVRTRRPGGLQRTVSTLSERAPLASVPSIDLDVAGEPTLIGRSGKSSHYQLSTSKFISRIHVRATYQPGNVDRTNRVEIVCLGANGVKIQCQGQSWELAPEDSFTSESQDIDIMLEVAGARVILRWPVITRRALTPDDTDSDHENTPRGHGVPTVFRSPYSSPLRNRARPRSPVSPTPAGARGNGIPASLDNSSRLQAPIEIYEDEEESKEGNEDEDADYNGPTQPTQLMSQPFGQQPEDSEDDKKDFSDQDEENEPLVHSMGPFGSNLLPRMESFTTGDSFHGLPTTDSVKPHRLEAVAEPARRRSLEETNEIDTDNPILNHVVNQLAYSRLSSVPLSTIMNNLPSELRDGSGEHKGLYIEALRAMIDCARCIGEVARAGKDAAGKPLESEYYYIPEYDFDEARRASVVDELRKPGLRSCRKQHKVILI